MEEFRCKFCHRLLAKVEDTGLVEIKCPKCKTMNLHCRDRAGVNFAILRETEKEQRMVGQAYAEVVPHEFTH